MSGQARLLGARRSREEQDEVSMRQTRSRAPSTAALRPAMATSPRVAAMPAPAAMPYREQTTKRHRNGTPDGAPAPLTITFCNRRGGCGKTTNAAAVGFTLAYRGYDVMLVDMDPQTDLSQFLMADKLEESMLEFNKKHKEGLHKKLADGKSRVDAEQEAMKEAKESTPHGYANLIDRAHIPDNEEGKKVRTLWEAMENFCELDKPSVPLEIKPFEILPREEGKHGRLMLVAGHEEMVQMESYAHKGEAASGRDLSIAWLTVPNHILKETAEKNR
jgi:hypothetical protein